MKIQLVVFATLFTSLASFLTFAIDRSQAALDFSQITNLSSSPISQNVPLPETSYQNAIARLLNSPKLQPEWFAPEFIAKVPIFQIQAAIASRKLSVGECRQFQGQDVSYLAVCDRGNVPIKIKLNAEGKITALFLGNPQQTLDQAVSGFKNLEGEVSLLVTEGKTQRVGLRVDAPMAVGSAFKLAVLKALKEQIAGGKITWDKVIALQADQQSLPTGLLQSWSAGSLLTVQTLAGLMISLSDNTASDTLIDLVGRGEVERFSSRNRPLLKTREMFTLRGSKNSELLQKYRLANTGDRLKILESISRQPLPDISDFINNPKISFDVEWIFTTRELCSLIEDVGDLPLMSFNAGLVDPSEWAKVAFKGGSDAGVLNFTTLLQSKSGKSYCVSVTWNNTKPLNESQLTTLYKGLIDTLPK
ncbi:MULTISPECIES: serine hydrolase [Pseudanabaena]|uniref:Serine hydrolase n=2 Tax=Pseudanabaena TaxID=1152 RepID=A0A9X4RIJ3_9CYAN|nr:MULTISPECIES: serine hydrolase [Pseudanabaena]ELS32056.1 putative beta-lactamase [Pseudanabaena biceps PCC 7429]MDG3495706.1 serine hydrolase [Pseudanabaena catenata USMAC16]